MRPISLEIRAQPTDDRVALSRDENQHGNQSPDLEDSIDALLDEIDAACAQVESPGERPTPKRLDQQPDDPPPESSEPDDQHGQDALDALDTVEAQTQSLIEDSIDELLGSETNEPEAETAESAADDAAIDAQLDALESAVRSTPSDAEGSSPAADELPGADDLLADIADELTKAAPPPGADTPEQTDADAAPQPEPATQAGTDADSPGAGSSTADPVAASEPEADTQPKSEPEPEPLAVMDEDEPDNAPAASEQTTATTDAAALDDLDATLARIGDELMGDFETPDGELVSADSLGDHDASALLEQLGLDKMALHQESDDALDGQDETPPERSADKAHTAAPDAPAQPTRPTAPPPVDRTPVAPSAAPKAAPANAAVSQTTPMMRTGPRVLGPQTEIEESEAEAEVRSIWESAWLLIGTNARRGREMLRTHGAPLGAKLVLAVNQPLKSRPPQLRDSIGYLALWTLLMATILWVYLAFIRESPTPTPTQAPTRVLEPGETLDPLHARGP